MRQEVNCNYKIIKVVEVLRHQELLSEYQIIPKVRIISWKVAGKETESCFISYFEFHEIIWILNASIRTFGLPQPLS